MDRHLTSTMGMFPNKAELEQMIKSVNLIDNPGSNPFPHYNVYSTNKRTYIDFALAGYLPHDLSVTTDNNVLIVESKVKEKEEEEDTLYRHQGITNKSFKKRFPLVEFAEVISVTFINGILSVALEVNIPEERLPKSFDIQG